MSHTVVIGGDPAALTTAYELSKHRHDVTVLEASDNVGGLFRTQKYQGYRIDLGAGGFSTNSESVQQLWDELVGDGAVAVEVRSLIHYHHRLFKYPLSATNALKHLGPIDTALTGISYLKNWLTAQHTPIAAAQTTQAWVNKRFGPHLNSIFFEPYFEKVWGLPSHQLAPRTAIHILTRPSGKDNTLIRAAIDAATEGSTHTVSYPRQGAGQAWETCQSRIEQAGSSIALNTQLIKIEHTDSQITQVVATAGDNIQTIPVEHLVSSLPLAELVSRLNAPPAVQASAQALRHRHSVQVALILDIADLFCEQSIHINHPHVSVSCIQNFKNWSSAMVPNPHKTCLGLTYFCEETDALWHRNESQLIQLASQELLELGLIESPHLIESGTVMHQPQAYPIHTTETLQHRAIVQNYLEKFKNLQTIGRHGLHRFARLSDDILNGQQAAANIVSWQPNQQSYRQHDLWQTAAQPPINNKTSKTAVIF